MKLAAYLFAFAMFVHISGCERPAAGVDEESTAVGQSPFRSIVVIDDTIIATLPKHASWMVRSGSTDPRKNEPSESFTLQAGSSLKLFERHASYAVTAQLVPIAGLKIESKFDGRSFGDEVKIQNYFIPAKQPTELETKVVSEGSKKPASQLSQ